MIVFGTALLASDPDRDRFARIYRDHYRRLHRLAAQLLGPGPKAEDAVHDAFVKLIRHFDELRDRPEDRLGAWLAVVVKNTALDMLRRKSGRRSWRTGMSRRCRRTRENSRRWWR